jgi:CRP-like cAMP-binding protein
MSADRACNVAAEGPRTSGRQPAPYLIRVQGAIDARWGDRLSGMVVTGTAEGPGGVTTLAGEMVDQAALLGVLNCLYNLGLPIVAVDRLGCLPGQAIGGATNERGTPEPVAPAEARRAVPTKTRPVSGAGARTVEFAGRCAIFEPGAGNDHLYLVRSGCVRLFKRLPDGRQVNVGLLGPRSLFGQEADPRGLASGVAAEALTESLITIIPAAMLAETIAASPGLAVTVVDALTRRLTAAQAFIEHLLTRDVAVRLASVLADLADAIGRPSSGGYVELPLTLSHRMLADMTGANRVTVTRKVGRLTASGMIRRRDVRHLEVQPCRLRAFARTGPSAG